MQKLNEVCRDTGVSRRAVQGYENAGLVRATAKNKYGHLLYGELEEERIKRIKFFQDMGLSLKEIEVLIDAPGEALKPVLEIQIKKLEESIERNMMLIRMANELIREIEKKR